MKNDHGTISTVSEFDYDPYGSILSYWGSDVRRQFLEKEKDNESSDNNLGVRQYGDNIGRFFCPDKMWEKYYSLSPYAYCGNNPVGASDASGLCELQHDYSTFIGPPTLCEMEDNPTYFQFPEIKIVDGYNDVNPSVPPELSSSSSALNPIQSGKSANSSANEVETAVATTSNVITAGQVINIFTNNFATNTGYFFTGLSEINNYSNYNLPSGDPNKINTNEFLYNTTINAATAFGGQTGAALGLWYGPVLQAYGSYYSQHSEEQKNGAMNTQFLMMQMGIPWAFP
jgi:RHS repeat-associated protein